MMSATIRRKALALCSSALPNNGIARALERGPPALAGSRSQRYVSGAPVYSEPLRDISLINARFSTQKWIKSFSTYSEPAKTEKMVNTSVKRGQSGSAYVTAPGAVVGSVLSTPFVNAPTATKLSLSSAVSPTFLPNLALFLHINNGIEEILADYVHHEMTRSLILVLMRLFLIVAAKDVFVATN